MKMILRFLCEDRSPRSRPNEAKSDAAKRSRRTDAAKGGY